MNKIVSVLLFSVTLLCATGCGSNRKPENKVVADAMTTLRQELPIELEGLGKVRDIDYEGNTVLLQMRIKEDASYGLSVSKISNNTELAKAIVSIQIGMMDDKKKGAIKAIAGQSYNLQVVVNGSDSHREGKINLSPEDLEAALANSQNKSADDFSLEMVAMSTRLMLPTRVDQVTTWIDTQLTDTAFEYIYRIDDDGIDLYSVDLGMMRNEKLSILRQNMDIMGKVVRCCIATNRNLVYKYIGRTSNKTIDVVLSPSDLRGI